VQTLYRESLTITPEKRDAALLGFGGFSLSFTLASRGRYNLTINGADGIDSVDHAGLLKPGDQLRMTLFHDAR
jgi:hypothetical protein